MLYVYMHSAYLQYAVYTQICRTLQCMLAMYTILTPLPIYTPSHTPTYTQTIIDEAQIVATDLYGEGMSPRDQQRFMFEKNSVSVWDLGMYTLQQLILYSYCTLTINIIYFMLYTISQKLHAICPMLHVIHTLNILYFLHTYTLIH